MTRSRLDDRSSSGPTDGLAKRRAELERLDAAIERVLQDQRETWERMAALSHKINNPLTSLIGRAQLLRHRHGNDEYVRHAAEVIEESSRRVADYLRELTGLVKERQQEIVRLSRESSGAND
ncbi:MAG TPA: histidine kinase dimerization/phospho-acceptor domain-containing protein [Candidatus Polarisedimenticolaceae bacterium]|nr:histidine kinase dimerization/phospho-acceptor domain-containing protein [Candidatus Polarisedimenticolaceae bacterium]